MVAPRRSLALALGLLVVAVSVAGGAGGSKSFNITYGVSLVDGFNLPLLVAPQGSAPAGGNCAPAGCAVDLNGACPAELRVASAADSSGAVACKSACQAFWSPEYCCTGEYGNSSTCKPSAYSELFKKACPRASSYAYDGADSTFTCGGSGTTYAVIFCPTTTSVAESSSLISQPSPPAQGAGTGTGTGTGDHQFPASSVVAGALSVIASVLSVLTAVLGGIFTCSKYLMKRRAKAKKVQHRLAKKKSR